MMVTGEDLAGILATIGVPGHAVRVRPVTAAAGYAIGRGHDGSVVVLTPPDPQPGPPTRLHSLQLAPSILLDIEDPCGRTSTVLSGMLRLHGPDDGMITAFLDVAASVVRLAGASPGPGVLSGIMRQLLDIFDPRMPARGSVLGLWGELWLIGHAVDPVALVRAWHARVDDRLDFARPGSRLEVKTTTRGKRIHNFDLHQLSPASGYDATIASIMTTETDAGTSLRALVCQVIDRLQGHPEEQLKVHTQVAATLGPEWTLLAQRRFDDAQAATSLSFLSAGDVPCVEVTAAAILDVSLTVDCSGVRACDALVGLAADAAPLARAGGQHPQVDGVEQSF